MTEPPAGTLQVLPVRGIPEVAPGADLAALVAAHAADLRDGDVVVVTSKVVSKAEGRLVPVPTDPAGREEGRLRAVADEAVRVLATRGDTRIVETRHGFVVAAGGVDASNVPPGVVALLPEDPDASARRIRAGLAALRGVDVAVVVTDTFGRPWREGVTDVAIGLAGLPALRDHRGDADPHGHPLRMTQVAVADEVAAAADLVKGKLAGLPVAVVRGLSAVGAGDDRGAAALVRPAAEDLFRLGSAEAARGAVLGRRTVTRFGAEQVPGAVVAAAVAAATTAPGSELAVPWRFVRVTTAAARARLAAALAGPVPAAPCLLVPCVIGAPGPADLLRAGAAVENLLVALAAEGVGSHWEPELPADAVAAALSLPPDWRPVGVVAAGYPVEEPTARTGPAVTTVLVDR